MQSPGSRVLNLVTPVLCALETAGLLTCDDWDAWQWDDLEGIPGHYRQFHPTFKLLLADWRGRRARTTAQFRDRKYIASRNANSSDLILAPDSGVVIPVNVAEAFLAHPLMRSIAHDAASPTSPSESSDTQADD